MHAEAVIKESQTTNSTKKSLQVFNTVKEFRLWREEMTGTVGFVATMGALHEGHLSLIKLARKLSDHLVVSIFVNPLQFGPKEDFGNYPRTMERDLELCSELQVDAVFTPEVEQIYPEGKDLCTKIIPPPYLGDVLEGAFRPGFFTGVATIVAKLFNIIKPDFTIFGEKDYQQLLVVKRMVSDLNMPVTVYGAPIVRAEDGLALSSRNAYLSEYHRKMAPSIYQTLKIAAEKIRMNPASVQESINLAKRQLKETGVIDLQYLEARDGETLAEISSFNKKIVLLAAAKIGTTRLIDNIVI